MADGTRMLQRRATEAVWTTSDYVLAEGELGVTTDSGIIKIGNGVNTWSELDPAFDSRYLPLEGTAANSDLLEGISADGFLKAADASTAATADKIAMRDAEGNLKAATAVDADDLTPLAQQTAAVAAGVTLSRQVTISRNLTGNGTLQAGDAGNMVTQFHNVLTTQLTMTVPLNSSVAFPVGTFVDVCATGNGGAKIVGAGGVLIRGVPNVFPGYGVVRVTKIGTDEWVCVAISSQRQCRLPKIRAVRTGGTGYINGTYVFVPYDQIDSSGTPDVYNPDNEWFSVPGAGLPTGRRIIVAKDGEYLAIANFISSNGSGTTYTRINKMVADNTLVGGSVVANQSMVGVGNISCRVRLAAGESLGVSHATVGGFGDLADGNGGNRHDFSITRIGD
jgi:hypothetical protein